LHGEQYDRNGIFRHGVGDFHLLGHMAMGIWVAILTWVGLGWGMLINFSYSVEKGQAKTHQRNVEKMEEIKKTRGEERVH